MISEETYKKVDSYCKKYDYGDDNISIVEERLKKDKRKRKLNRLIEE